MCLQSNDQTFYLLLQYMRDSLVMLLICITLVTLTFNVLVFKNIIQQQIIVENFRAPFNSFFVLNLYFPLFDIYVTDETVTS